MSCLRRPVEGVCAISLILPAAFAANYVRRNAVAPDAVSAVTTPKRPESKWIKKHALSEPKASFACFPL